MLLKITKKIVQRNVFEQNEDPDFKALIGLRTTEPCRTSIAPVKACSHGDRVTVLEGAPSQKGKPCLLYFPLWFT